MEKWRLATILSFYLLSPLKRHGFCTNVELFDEYNVTSSEGTYRFWIKDTLLDYFIIPWCSCITLQLFKQYNLTSKKIWKIWRRTLFLKKRQFSWSLWILSWNWNFWWGDKTLRYACTNCSVKVYFLMDLQNSKLSYFYWHKSKIRIEFWPMNIYIFFPGELSSICYISPFVLINYGWSMTSTRHPRWQQSVLGWNSSVLLLCQYTFSVALGTAHLLRSIYNLLL